MKKKEQKKLQGAKKFKESEGMVWAPPTNETSWPDWDEARKEPEPESDGGARNNYRVGCGGEHPRGP